MAKEEIVSASNKGESTKIDADVMTKDQLSMLEKEISLFKAANATTFQEKLLACRSIVQDYFVNGTYTIVYRPWGGAEYTWGMTTKPEWRWDKYEYRAFKIVSTIPMEGMLDSLFVYGFGYNIYFNDYEGEFCYGWDADWDDYCNQYMSTWGMNGTTLDKSFDEDFNVDGDFTCLGDKNYIGDENRPNAELNVLTTVTTTSGPSIKFYNADKSNNATFTYYNPNSTPSFELTSKNNDVMLRIDNTKIPSETVTDSETVGTLTANTSTMVSAKMQSMSLKNVADVMYPVGSYYWSSVYKDPGELFSGTWQQVVGAFLWATGDTSDGNMNIGANGEYEHVLTINEIPTHNHLITETEHVHNIYDPQHLHVLYQEGHTHTMTDYGHTHPITDKGHKHNLVDPGHSHCVFGDDQLSYWMSDARVTCGYDACSKRSGGSAWFWTTNSRSNLTIYSSNSTLEPVEDVANFEINSTDSGAYAANGKTKISILTHKSNVTVDNQCSNWQHNNMPPYINCYCWHRIS